MQAKAELDMDQVWCDNTVFNAKIAEKMAIPY